MAVESKYDYIDDLNPSWPNDNPDQLAQQATQTRGVKSATKGSFPNLGQAAVTKTAAELNASLIPADIINLIYPVGAIYCSASSTDPNTLFGVGVWTALADKQTLVQQGTYAAGSAGGSSTAVVVSHNHTQAAHTHTYDKFVRIIGTTLGNGSSIADSTTPTSTGNTTPIINSTGVSGVNENMPPYLAVYMWQRIA